jgi:hypothetical protein
LISNGKKGNHAEKKNADGQIQDQKRRMPTDDD